jgi:hexosaminidase
VWPSLVNGSYAWPSYSHTYSPEDVQTVIDYAYNRGVRVIPEFDTPGHSLSWGVGYPQLLTACYDGAQPNGQYGPINPTNPFVYQFLQKLFSELKQVFPDQYVHIGGDEVDFSCWQSNPQCQQWMQQNNYTNYAMLEQYYETSLLNVLNQIGVSYICWEDVFDNGVKLNPDTVVEVWRDGWNSTIASVTEAGYRTILSTPWYLNYIAYGSVWPA